MNKTAVVLLNRLRQMSQEKQDTITKEIEASTHAADAMNRQKGMFTKKDSELDNEETDEENSDVDDKGKNQK